MFRPIKYSQEHRSHQPQKQRFLAVALAFATLQAGGCLEETGDQPSDKILGKASGELRLVKAEYPIPGEGGSVICAEYEYDGEDGLTYTSREQYDEGFAKLRSMLGADAALERVANEQGVSAIETCDDARKFNKIWAEYTESKPSIERKPAAGGTRPPREPSTDLIEKVKDSNGFSGTAVNLRIWSGTSVGGCSGFFIGDGVVVTAAHCIPANGNRKITVESFAGCVYPAGGSCTTTPPNNSSGEKHDSWPGGVNASHDIGVFLLWNSVGSPMNSSSNWMRVATSVAWEGQSVWLDAWGSNSYSGSGAGTQRLSQQDIEIDWVGTNYFLFDIVSGEGRSCVGDSGGPTTATEVASFDIVIGDVSNSDKTGTNACGSPGLKDRHTGIWDNDSFLQDWAGPCSEFVGFSTDFTYIRCW